MSESDTHPDALAHRNLMRQSIEDLARAIRDKDISPDETAERLDDIAAADLADLDTTEIEIDFESGDGSDALADIAHPKPVDLDGDPVEKALTRTTRLRDRLNGLTIVGDAPGRTDRGAYAQSLCDLRDALVAANLTS